MTKLFNLRVHPDELTSWQEAAALAGLSTSAWVKHACSEELVRGTLSEPVDSDVAEAESPRGAGGVGDPPPAPRPKEREQVTPRFKK